MTLAELQEQLADAFTVDGIIGGNIKHVADAEDQVGTYLASNFHGHNVLLDSFQSFFIETLELTNLRVASSGWPPQGSYPLAFVQMFNLFRRFRACEILYTSGYPFESLSLMREIKDRALMLAGIAHNMTTFVNVIGAPSIPRTDKKFAKQAKENRQAEEIRIKARLIGDKSGLSADVQEDLKSWVNLFHMEVHGSSLSFSQELLRLYEGKGGPQIGPSVVQEAFEVYMNRSAEVGWMIVRLLPFLQMSEESFGHDWSYKSWLLDELFRAKVAELAMLGKRLGTSFITMIDSNLTFKQPFFYFEADGSA